MEGYTRKEEMCPQFLDLVSEEKKLELRLGPPGGDEWTIKVNNTSSKAFGYYLNNPWQQNQAKGHFLNHQQLPVKKELSQPCKSSAENKAPANTAVPNTNTNTAQKRTAPAPVVGWPPVRSFRKNLASGSSSKSASASPDNKAPNQKPIENCTKGLFVKINMDGIPIGRKVDLKACDSYVKLSYAVDELFRGLLAAQKDPSGGGGGMKDREEGVKVTGGLLDGSGEYTLVYEDNEGDRMLVGDVPWDMFISTVKRLRVLKSSELSKLSGASKQEKLSSALT